MQRNKLVLSDYCCDPTEIKESAGVNRESGTRKAVPKVDVLTGGVAMKKLTLVTLAAVAMFVPLAAQAGLPSSSFEESQNGDNIGFEGSANFGGSFTDSFTFYIPSGGSSAALTLSGIDAKLSSLSDVTISLDKGTKLIPGVETSSFIPNGKSGGITFVTDSFSNLSSGTYTINISGKWGQSGGNFGGGVLVSAVPEPASWAALVVGLTMMGYLRQRRRARAT